MHNPVGRADCHLLPPAGQCPVPFAAAGQNTNPAAIYWSGWVLRRAVPGSTCCRRIEHEPSRHKSERLGSSVFRDSPENSCRRCRLRPGWGRLRIRFALPQTPTEVCLLPTRATGFLHRKTRPLKVRAGRKGVFRIQAEFLGKICPVRIRQYAVVAKRRGLRPGDRALLQRLAQAAIDVVLVFARREKSRSYSAHSRDHVCKFCTFWHFSVVRAKKAPGRALRPGEVAIISCPC